MDQEAAEGPDGNIITVSTGPREEFWSKKARTLLEHVVNVTGLDPRLHASREQILRRIDDPTLYFDLFPYNAEAPFQDAEVKEILGKYDR